MKKILICIVINLLLSASALSDDQTILIKKMQLALDKNQLEQVEDIFENNDGVLSKNWMAQERLALSYERRNKLKEAVDVYKVLVNVFNKEAHQKIFENNNSGIDEKLFTTNKLPYYYYKLAFLNAQLFKTTNKYISIEERKKYLGNVQGYLKLCKKVKTEETDINSIEEMIKEKIRFENSNTFQSHYYSLFELISWQDRVELVNLTSNQKTKLLSTAVGLNFGFGKKWENIKYEFNFEGGLTFAKSTTSSEDPNIIYAQSSVNIKSIILGPGFYYKAFSEKAFLGVQFPVSYRTGDWSIPNGSYKLEKDKLLGVGYFLQLKFYVGKFALQTRLGKIFPNPASHWSIGGIYDF